MTYHHSGDQPVYAPNSYGGPAADPSRATEIAWDVEAAELGRTAYEKHAEDDDFGQPGTLIREVMGDAERDALVTNIVDHASDDVTPEMQLRVVAYWTRIDERSGGAWPRASAATNGHTPAPDDMRRAQELVDARAGSA